MTDAIPLHIQRFILTSIDSVPHLEAILLLCTSVAEWTAAHLAQRLFITEKKAGDVLSDLCAAGFASKSDTDLFRYDPASPDLREMVDELDEIYPRQLVQVSRFIHMKTYKQAQAFGDAFKWRKE